MSWLALYHAILDCHAKTITLAMPGIPRLEWKGAPRSAPKKIICFLRAKKLVVKGCLAYLAHIRDTRADIPSLESVLVVSEFAEVFLIDLLGMPPDRDIDLCIDLEPGTRPISIPQYHMASTELRELKEQLQDLLSKGFIDLEEHEKPLRIVLRSLKDKKLYAKFFNCEFWLNSTAFLGLVVYKDGVMVDPKIELVREWARPTLVIDSELYRLSKFMKGKDFIVYYDASRIGLGYVFMQKGKVIVYALRQFKVHEKNYPTHDLDLAAIVFALTILTHYLYGVYCEVFTDHHSLEHVFNQRDLNSRQRRWMELLKDYDITILFHPRKVNVVADVSSRKGVSIGSLSHLIVGEHPLVMEVQSLANSIVRLDISEPRYVLACVEANEAILNDEAVLRIKGRICVPRVGGLIKLILEKAYSSRYFIHLVATKMYRKLRQHYWWGRMKRDIVDFISQCLNCQQVNCENQRSGGRATQFTSHFWRTLQKELGTQLNLSTVFHPHTDGQFERTIQVLEDMFRTCVIDFSGHWDQFLPLAELAYNNSYHSNIDMAPFEVLYGRRCHSSIGWLDAFEVLLKVLPMKRMIRFRKKGNLSLRIISPFEILRRIGEVAYESALPPGLPDVHPVFHVSMLKMYHSNGSYVIQWGSVLFDHNLSFKEEPVAILDRQVRKLRSKEIASVKVQWKQRPVEEA
ncbi:uncharacterized protein LOC132644107 [Lycium barbarum]|uniref:uncharacterized protein LOC132644107 n=1 Tax=Lycium barbarum TaxID=112863 RepID=UPI00293EAD6D|nr:uncharacterized protein LOC132644107 [Lycium barbarum]